MIAYLGSWKKHELKEAMSNVEVEGDSVEVIRWLFLLFGGKEAPAKSASVDDASKNELPADEASVGDPKGLSGRLCSTLLPWSQRVPKKEKKKEHSKLIEKPIKHNQTKPLGI